ncbi:glycogen synthase GlgA [Bacillus sp. DJP31]|uniref:glycogen synthase GlgA n=1 Tax=Bacillus sp. DJP31 TaxID=3409789 RepID=UPI003BB5B756
MNVLFAVSECVPFVKTGGLADVAGSLPLELQLLGTNVAVVMPLYGSIEKKYKDKMEFITSFTTEVGWRQQYVGIKQMQLNEITYYFIDNEYYFDRDTLYGHFDDGERFSFFNKAVLESIPHLSFVPALIHCHDWHTGMIPFLLKVKYRKNHATYENMKTIFTIHNLHFQGLFPREILHELLNVEDYYFTKDYVEFNGNVSFMKAAINCADFITTVSPTYCQEIQTSYFGEGLDGLLRERRDQLVGILNGIDDTSYNPGTDLYITNPYDMDSLEGKIVNKLELQQYFDLNESPSTPLIVMITRLTKQKGLDLVKHIFHDLMREDVQFIVLGTGEPTIEHFFQEMSYTYPEKVRAYIGFDEQLAHKVYAGADLFLMPSQFEPCGLGQLIAMKYGTIPVVRETGGLNDTVQSYNEDEKSGNGFSFSHFNADDMLFTIKRALNFYNDQKEWATLASNAMGQDYSWSQSAFIYNQLYSKLSSPVRSEMFVLKQRPV